MDGGQITAIVIVAIVMLASVLRAGIKMGHQRKCGDDGEAQVENQRLQDEVLQLKERLKVLERITVDKENSLSREIESLRDR